MKSKRILLVDDNELLLKVLKDSYQAEGYDVITASHGADALQILMHRQFDLVVTDVLMPVMDGYQLCYKIRNHDRLKDLPVIIHTATYLAEGEEKIAKEMGANMFISKTASPEAVMQATKDILANPGNFKHVSAPPPQSTENMLQYNAGLVNKLEERNRELEQIKVRLEQNLSRLKEAQQIAHLGNWELDFATQITTWSDEAWKIFGLSPQHETASRNLFLSHIHPDDYEFAKKAIIEAEEQRTELSLDCRLISKNGEVLHTHTSSRFEFDSKGAPVRLYGIIHDITEKVKADEELANREKHFRALIENSTDAIILVNEAGEIFYQSPSVERIYGYTFEERNGKSFFDFIPVEDIPQIKEAYKLILQSPGISRPISRRLTHKNGSFLWVEGTISNLLHVSHVKAVVLNYRDVTEKRQAEEEINKLNEELEDRVKQRTAELVDANQQLEAFSYSVSHDLRAPLRTINAFAKILEKKYANMLDEDGKTLVDTIVSSTIKLQALINDILTFSKMSRKNIEQSRIDIRELVIEVCSNILESVPVKPEITILELPVALADKPMITQVFVNFISNAVKYSSKKEKPMIWIGAEECENETIYFVKDNGDGFDMKYYDKLFGVFQRLHNSTEFEGTGVGLAIVKRIIDKHNGRVWGEGVPGEGASFYFSLPKCVN